METASVWFKVSGWNWNLEVLVFVEGGKPENPEKPRSKARTNNKLNPHETASTGIEPGSQRWEASAYPLRQPFSRKYCSPQYYTDSSCFVVRPLFNSDGELDSGEVASIYKQVTSSVCSYVFATCTMLLMLISNFLKVFVTIAICFHSSQTNEVAWNGSNV